MPRELTVLAPGLLGPLPGVPADHLAPAGPLPGLEALIGRAGSAPLAPQTPEQALLHLFGCDSGSGVAALSYLGDTGHWPSGPVLRADPVHMRAATGALMQFDAAGLGLLEQEAAALVQACNELLQHDGARLAAPVPERWYLLPGHELRARTRPLSEARGVDLTPLMPDGPDGVSLRALLTELQMVLSDHPVNRERERAGRPAANSLWLWGAGSVPTPGAGYWRAVWSRDALAAGLALQAHVPTRPPPADAASLLAMAGQGPELLLLDDAWTVVQFGDPAEWSEVLQRLDRQWFLPLWRGLTRGQLARVHLLPLNGRSYRASAWNRWRVWRPRRRLARIVAGT